MNGDAREKPQDASTEYWCRWKFARLAVPLQEKARSLGYALLFHGSMRRDIDVVAVPWTDEAVSAEEFAREIEAEIRAKDVTPPPGIETQGPTSKPHGRKAWSIFVQGTYFDLSVAARTPPTATKKDGQE